MDQEIVDKLILTLRDTERQRGMIPQTFQQWQPFAEALAEAGFVHRDEVMEHLNGWEPMAGGPGFSVRLDADTTEALKKHLEVQHVLMRKQLEERFF